VGSSRLTGGRRHVFAVKFTLQANPVKNTKLTKYKILNTIHYSPFTICFQSKTLTLKNKNKIFPKFLSPFTTTIYGQQSKKNGQIFDSKLHTPLIIEGQLVSLTQYEILSGLFWTEWNPRYEIPNFSSL
jgi:hypothetical protein